MYKKILSEFLFFLVLAFIFFSSTLIVSVNAAGSFDYTPMETLPGFGNPADFTAYILALYKFGIWTVGICALIMIVIGGYKYAASAGNNASMENAKGFITDAIIGLVLALLAYLILYVINPKLIEIKMSSASTTPILETPAPPPSLPPGLLPKKQSDCQKTKNQVPSQCQDASANLNTLISCVNTELAKTNKQVQISSISDGNGGINCYRDHPAWLKCTTDAQTSCCFHSKTSCHYGGNSGGKSCAVDYSTRGSSATNAEIIQATSSCGGSAINEGNHVHASVSGCGCT